MMYARGRGVMQNDDEAIYWYSKAAEQGFDEAEKAIKEFDN